MQAQLGKYQSPKRSNHCRMLWESRRPTGSNPFHPSRDPLAAILPLFPRRFQLPIPLGLNLLLMPGEHVLWRDVADGTVQTHVVVMLYVTLNQTPRIFERQRRPGPNALPLRDLCQPSILPFD